VTLSTGKKKRVLHLAHEMGVGGTQQVIRQLICNLDDSLYECSVACIDGYVGMIGEQLQDDGIRFHVFNRQPGFDRALISDVRSLIAEQSIDLIHCHQYTPWSYGALAAIFTDVKVLFTEHGRFYPDSYSWKRRLINPLLARGTDSIVAISAATADALAEYEWFSRSAIDVVYNGFEAQPESTPPVDVLTQFGIASDAIVFGTIARFDPIKNLPIMIEAFRAVKLQVPDAILLLVGDGDERDRLEAMVREADLQNSVIFTGYQSDTARLMSVIDVYLLTSFSEGTSMTLLEAMASQKPSIVTSVGGNVEIITHMKHGLVIESEDTKALIDRMCELAGSEDYRTQLGEAAVQEYSRRFSVDSMTGQYEAIYQRCLGR